MKHISQRNPVLLKNPAKKRLALQEAEHVKYDEERKGCRTEAVAAGAS